MLLYTWFTLIFVCASCCMKIYVPTFKWSFFFIKFWSNSKHYLVIKHEIVNKIMSLFKLLGILRFLWSIQLPSIALSNFLSILERSFLPFYKVNCLHCTKFKLALDASKRISILSLTACSTYKCPQLLYGRAGWWYWKFFPPHINGTNYAFDSHFISHQKIVGSWLEAGPIAQSVKHLHESPKHTLNNP